MRLTTKRTFYVIDDHYWRATESTCPPEANASVIADNDVARDRSGRDVMLQQGTPDTLLREFDIEAARAVTRVVGGSNDRLPLACVRSGISDYAEQWFYARNRADWRWRFQQPLYGYRTFMRDSGPPPFRSSDMHDFIRASGAPHLLLIRGLGIARELMEACSRSFTMYYAGTAVPLRVPATMSRLFDLILVGADWQRDVVLARHPEARCEILPLGPEFADLATFRPLDIAKEYDVVYVGVARSYKCHDMLFSALARSPRRLRCLCVVAYGELADELQATAKAMKIDVDFVGPPGVTPEEVNYHMNRARIGVVMGINDACPAVMTEYMLAGLPVIANAELRCGLAYINGETGLIADRETLPLKIGELLDQRDQMHPREYAAEHWGWPATMRKFARMLSSAGFPAADFDA